MDVAYVTEHTIFDTVVGSRAYGTHREDSDTDKAGIMIPGQEYFLGLEKFDQFQSFGGEDHTVFDIRKILSLMLQNNPNCLDLLYAPDRCVLKTTPSWEKFKEIRQSFLSKRVRYTYGGYAFAQLKRIKTHRKFLLQPPKVLPLRTGFGLPEQPQFPTMQLKAVMASSLDYIPEHRRSSFVNELDRIYGDYIVPLFEANLIVSERLLALEWLQLGVKAQANAFLSAHTLIKDEFVDETRRELAYYTAMKEYNQYQDWKKHRNKARAALEEKWGYDCYLDDTEFLTDAGWKRYDEITDKMKLSTLNMISKKVEHQNFTDRLEKSYSGKIGEIHSLNTSCAITMGHRMLLSPAHRSSANGFSWSYSENDSKWDLIPLEDVLKGNRSYFHIFLAGEPTTEDYPIEDDYLILMGAYVSEGCVGKRLSDNSASVLRISQKEGGRICPFMDSLMQRHSDQIRRFVYIRDEEYRKKPCTEVIWTIANKEWASKLERECGSGSLNKKLPFWTRQLSERQAKLLLNILVSGDGTERKFSKIYYTASKSLADDIQSMCVSVGIVSQVWGPYPDKKKYSPMYHVYLGKRPKITTVCLREEGSQSFDISEVNNVRVVCFTVPNGTLITRRNGQVAIQGNCKHAMHLCRLFRQGKEILETGFINVDRTGIDADELIAIRNGSWSYEQVEEFAEEMDKEFEELYKKSTLPKNPDRNKILDLCVEVVSENIR